MERSNSFLSRLRGSFRSKRPGSATQLLGDADLEGDGCAQCRASALIAHRAAYYGHVGCLAWLEREEPEKLDSVDRNGATPLLLAIRQNRIKAVSWILTHCPNQSRQKATGGETPVLVGAAQGRLKCLEMLLEFEPKVKASLSEDIDSGGLSAIHLAALKNRTDTVAWILKVLGKTCVIHPSRSGITAVHIAAASGHLNILELLTKKDKRGVFYVDSAGTTPVYFAAQEGRLECMRHMVENVKADAISRCDDGMTTVHCAAQGGHLHVVQWLVTTQGEEVVLAKTQDGATPVHFAAAMGHAELLEWILSLPKIGEQARNTTDLDGGTPAHDAADNGQLQCLVILKAHGADMSATDNDGFTAVDLAVNSTDSKCREWAADMLRQASWQNRAFRDDEAEEIHASAAAAAASATSFTTNDGSPALPPREDMPGLTQDDRAKSSSREINIDEAVSEAAKKDALQRAGTLPNPQRTRMPPSPRPGKSTDKAGHTDTPYAVPMRLLSKIRSNTVGHRPDKKQGKDMDHSELRMMMSSGHEEFGDEETSLINRGAIEDTDGGSPCVAAANDSPDVPPKTVDSMVLLTIEDSDGETKSIHDSDNAEQTGGGPTQEDEVSDSADARARSATLPARFNRLSTASDKAAGSDRESPLPIRGRALFIEPSPSSRIRKPSPSPLPDARASPLMQRIQMAKPTDAGRKLFSSSDSSDDDDDKSVQDDIPASQEEVKGIFSKATQATKLLVTSSSESSSADESD